MDLEPGRIGFMSTQRRENRWQRRSCTANAEESGRNRPPSLARHAPANATVGTAPPHSAWLATNSLQSDYRTTRLVRRELQRSSPPPGAGLCVGSSDPALGPSLPHIPLPSGFACFHPSSPQAPTGRRRWAERYDGKRDLHLQHAARNAARNS